MMNAAQVNLVRLLAQLAVAGFLAEVEAEAGDEHSEGDQVDNARDTDASTLGKAA